MSYLAIGILGVLATWKWGKWKNWKEYYPTILYVCIGNLVYLVLAQPKPLWCYGETLKAYPVFEIIMMVLLYPSMVILFLSHYPFFAPGIKQAGYIALCVVIFSALEAVALVTGGFRHCNGWNLLLSVAFNAIMFPLIYLHYKKPLLAWPISAAMAFLTMFLFDIPFRK